MKALRKLCVSTKFTHQEIRWDFSILRSADCCNLTCKLMGSRTFLKELQTTFKSYELSFPVTSFKKYILCIPVNQEVFLLKSFSDCLNCIIISFKLCYANLSMFRRNDGIGPHQRVWACFCLHEGVDSSTSYREIR